MLDRHVYGLPTFPQVACSLLEAIRTVDRAKIPSWPDRGHVSFTQVPSYHPIMLRICFIIEAEK